MQERSELDKLREKVETLQDKLKQKTKRDVEEGPDTEKPVVEELIKEDRVRLRSHKGLSYWPVPVDT